MTDGFERNDMNNMNSENEQVQNNFSTAGNSQTDTSANASGYNAGSSYTSSYDAQQNAYNSYYNYANGANMSKAGRGMLSRSAWSCRFLANCPKLLRRKKRTESRAALGEMPST